MPLLDWLERCALPEESKLADPAYAGGVAAEFLDGLLGLRDHDGAGLRVAFRRRRSTCCSRRPSSAG